MSRARALHTTDREWMEQALALAVLGEGTTSPNPRVGCVLVRDGRAVGWGYHQAAGMPHAEARAVAVAGSKAQGATLYVNLEPCAHQGRTPPCSDLLVKSGVRRVVASLADPNPQVNGRGFGRLREAGVEVEVGLLNREASALNEPFLNWHATGRPLVTLKAAVSLDGMISAGEGRSRWITGEPARRFVHRMRFQSDAILVGAATVRQDDPRLNVRIGDVVAERLRVVLAPTLDVSPQARAFGPPGREGPLPRVYASRDLPTGAESHFAGKADVVRAGATENRLDLGEVLSDLGRLGIQSLLVEGGSRTFAGFLDAGLADRAAVFLAPRLLGARGGTPMLERSTAQLPELGWRMERRQVVPLGEDLLILGRLRLPAGG